MDEGGGVVRQAAGEKLAHRRDEEQRTEADVGEDAEQDEAEAEPRAGGEAGQVGRVVQGAIGEGGKAEAESGEAGRANEEGEPRASGEPCPVWAVAAHVGEDR